MEWAGNVRRGRLAIGFAALLGLVLTAGCEQATNGADSAASACSQPTDFLAGDFELIDTEGQTVTQADFTGRYVLTYFGFASCPDVCPLSLRIMTAALDQLGDDAAKVQPVFFTVDPDRDTPEALKDYLAFDSRIKGLTGTSDQIKTAAQAFRIAYRKVPDENSALGYTMDHTSLFYLLNPEGKLLTYFNHQSSPEEMADGIKSCI